VLVNSTTKIN
jgi:hypothetical protein